MRDGRHSSNTMAMEMEPRAVGGAGGGQPPVAARAAPSLRTAVFETASGNGSGLLARFCGAASLVTILLSIVFFCAGTLPRMQNDELIGQLEAACIAIFSVEYVAKLLCATARPGPDQRLWTYVLNPVNVVDLVSIAPWYIELVMHEDAKELAMLRVLRVLRVLRLGGYSVWMQIFATGLRRSSDAFVCLFIIGTIACVMFGAVIYELENTEQPEKFTSIPASFYYVLVTLTTVGYGDIVPKTATGQLCSCIMAISGVVIMCLPVAILSKQFDLAITEFQLEEEKDGGKGAEEETDRALLRQLVGQVATQQQQLAQQAELLGRMSAQLEAATAADRSFPSARRPAAAAAVTWSGSGIKATRSNSVRNPLSQPAVQDDGDDDPGLLPSTRPVVAQAVDAFQEMDL